MKPIGKIALPCLLLLVGAAIMLPAGEAAGDGGGGGTPGGGNMLILILTCSWVEWILILLSIIGVSLGIHRLISIKSEALVPELLVDDMHNIFGEGVDDEAVEEAQNVVAGDQSMLGEILAAALDKRDFGFDSMREAAEATAASEYNKYMAQINWLSLFAAIGPMLGLLGTVWGMIGAFFKMASVGGSVEPSMLANEIGGAMITTATGLIIAIPMMFLFFFLRARVNRCLLESTNLVGEVLDYFRSV